MARAGSSDRQIALIGRTRPLVLFVAKTFSVSTPKVGGLSLPLTTTTVEQRLSEQSIHRGRVPSCQTGFATSISLAASQDSLAAIPETCPIGQGEDIIEVDEQSYTLQVISDDAKSRTCAARFCYSPFAIKAPMSFSSEPGAVLCSL
jgi:hypothetical protein